MQQSTAEAFTPPIFLLPAEVIVSIAGWLCISDLGRLESVCHHLRAILSHESIWRSVARRDLCLSHQVDLPAHHTTWKDLCIRLKKFQCVQPRISARRAGRGAEWQSSSRRRFRPYVVQAEDLRGMSEHIAITFWIMMADRRHLEDPMPLIFVLDKFCIVVSPNDAFLRVVARSFGEEEQEARGIGVANSHRDMEENSDAESDMGSDAGCSDTDSASEAQSGCWFSKTETGRTLPVLQWTHVTVRLTLSNDNSDALIFFNSENVGSSSVNSIFFRRWNLGRAVPPPIMISKQECLSRSIIRDVRIYDGSLHEEDIAYLSGLEPHLPDEMAKITADTLEDLKAVSHPGVTCDGCMFPALSQDSKPITHSHRRDLSLAWTAVQL